MLPPPAGEEEEKMSWCSGTEKEVKAEGRPLQLFPISSEVQPKERKGEKLLAFANGKMSPKNRRVTKRKCR